MQGTGSSASGRSHCSGGREQSGLEHDRGEARLKRVELIEHPAQPLLRLLAAALGTTPERLAIYDPYYCRGGPVRHLRELGFTSVHHRNEDFYQVIASGDTPEYDVLLTNPPWSGDHIERCLRFASRSGRAWFLLLLACRLLSSFR